GRASPDPACRENAFKYEGPLWANSGTPTDAWFYNESTAGRAHLAVSATTSDIKQAATNITHGINNCGFAEGTFGVRSVFKGNTGKFANLTSSAKCSSKFPDGQNTMSFGPFDSSHPNTLAVTCFAWKTDSNGTEAMVEADTYIGSNRHMVDKFPSRCTNSFDLQSTMTHEFGHAFGMDHETSGTHEVMYPFESPCALRRHLGGGDRSGMAGLYPWPDHGVADPNGDGRGSAGHVTSLWPGQEAHPHGAGYCQADPAVSSEPPAFRYGVAFAAGTTNQHDASKL